MQDFLPGVTLDRTLPLRDQIYGIVRRAIVTGALPPGAVIDEDQIAGRLGTSRTPVREAVKKASDEGLVDVRVSSLTGKRAHPLDPAAVVETLVVNQLPAEPQPGDPGYLPPGAEPGAQGTSGAVTVF